MKYIKDASYKMYSISDSKVILKTFKGRFLIKGESISKYLGDIIEYFKEPRELDEAINHFENKYSKDSLTNLLEYLIEKSILVNNNNIICERHTMERINYLKLYGLDYKNIAFKFATKKIGIIGNNNITYLILKEIIELDFINEINYFNCEKDRIMNENLATLLKNKKVVINNELDSLICNSNFIIVASDYNNSYLYSEVNKVCIDNSKEWLRILVDGSYSEIGPIFVPNETCCYECLNYRAEYNIQKNESAFSELYKDKYRANSLNNDLFECYYIENMIASFTVFETLKYLLDLKSLIVGSVLRVDFYDYEIKIEKVFKNSNCLTCNKE